MRGLLYKYFRQNIFLIIVTTFLPSLMFILFMLLSRDLGEVFSAETELLTFAILVMGYLITQMIHSGFLSGDEMKKWAYFTVSSPKGVKGVVYYRYLFMAMVSGMTFIFMMTFDRFYIYLSSFYLDEPVSSMSGIIVLFFFFEMFINSIEMVFNSRYGSAHGGHVKFAIFVAFCLIAFLLGLFVPFGDADNITDAVFGTLMKILEGDVPNWFMSIIMSFPAFSILCYIASYQLSCRLYMKGVEDYEK